MKIFNLSNIKIISSCAMLMLVFAASPEIYAQDANKGKQTGFEQGKHEGHLKENGKRLGHENERNPWHGFYDGAAGEDIDLTVHNHAIIPNVTFTATYNSLMTIQEVLASILGGTTDGFYLQECYEERILLVGIESDCTDGESAAPLDSNLTLEDAGIIDDPEVHLVHIP